MAKGPAEVAHGPMLIGFVFNILLYGIMMTQVYLYYVTFKRFVFQPPPVVKANGRLLFRDHIWMKLFVALLFVLDTLNAAFDFAYMYESLVIHFGDIPFLNNADWVFATDPVLTGIIACLVQLFFVWRIKVLTGNYLFVAVVTLATLAGCAGGIATTVEVIQQPRFTLFQNFKSVVILWLAAECVADISITGILVWHLRKHKSGFNQSDEVIDRIIRLTMQTGMLTSICASLDLIFFLCDPTGTHLIFNFPLSKLYTNSLMSTLNARRPMGSQYTKSSQASSSHATPGTTDSILSVPSRYWSNDPMGRGRTKPLSQDRSVVVHVESHELRQMDSVNAVMKAEPLEEGYDIGKQTLDV
ncbi:hypothetical protein CYLTODRAFT_487422 [Cylindrobasidium torrendii FP15055 ss-10]|uniref:DUF6534 domain-containing protein n=1 Tax=Cylindrobasidium torrendii FP15055 ss-10 TaxID=1314674 RepID=A0A0D7BM44_9AGAR|nr:hypothetical protein CYLTODRAFT_487422 [Cylindrobasidium torrendii FP15055 ss-10]